METFGEFLKNHREKKGIRLEEIASITKIHLHILQFLEEGAWKELPPEPFIRGFIIAYAKYVGLDTQDTLERYALEVGKSKAPPPNALDVISTNLEKNEAAVAESTPSPSFKEKPAEELLNQPHTVPLKKFAIGIGAALVLILVVSLVLVGKKNDPETPVTASNEIAPPVQPEVSVAPAVPSNTVATASAPVELAKPVEHAAPPTERTTASEKVAPPPVVEEKKSDFPHEITVDAKDRSWMKVVIDDAPPKEMYTKPGEHSVFQAKEKIKVVVGNIASTSVSYNGEKTEGKKYQGTIHFFVYPKGSRFPQDPPKRATATKPAEENALQNLGMENNPAPSETKENKPE